MSNFANKFDSYVNLKASPALDNRYIKTLLAVVIITYGGLVVPMAPAKMSHILSSTTIRLALLLLIFYLGVKQPGLAVLLTVTLLVAFVHCDNYKREQAAKKLMDTVQDISIADLQADSNQAVIPLIQGVQPATRISGV